MRRFSGTALAGLLFYSIAVLWVRERWAWCIFQVSVFALTAGWLAAWAAGRQRLTWNWALSLLAAMTGWGLAQLAWGQTIYRWQTWMAVLDWVSILAAGFVAVQVCADFECRHDLLRRVAWFALVLSAVAAMQMFTSGGKVYWLFESGYQDQVLGPFVYRNQYGAFLELLLPVVMWQGLTDPKRALLYQITAAVMVASVIEGASRAGSALIVIEMLVCLGLALAQGRIEAADAWKTIGKVVGLAAVFTLVVGWETLWNRLQQPDPFAVRREILWSSMKMARARPVWGFGLGTWATAYPAHAYYDDGTFVNQAHDDWAQWAAEGGAPLLALMAALFGIIVAPAIRSVWGLGVLFVLVHAVIDYPLQQRPPLAAWFFVFAVMLTDWDRQRRMSDANARTGR